MTVTELSKGNWAVIDSGGSVIRWGFETNADAWAWIDNNTDEGREDAGRFKRNRIIFDGSGAP